MEICKVEEIVFVPQIHTGFNCHRCQRPLFPAWVKWRGPETFVTLRMGRPHEFKSRKRRQEGWVLYCPTCSKLIRVLLDYEFDLPRHPRKWAKQGETPMLCALCGHRHTVYRASGVKPCPQEWELGEET